MLLSFLTIRLEEFIHRQLPICIAIGPRELPGIGSLDALVLCNGQHAILVGINEEKHLSHALKELDAPDLAVSPYSMICFRVSGC
jgi:hypothetical protein